MTASNLQEVLTRRIAALELAFATQVQNLQLLTQIVAHIGASSFPPEKLQVLIENSKIQMRTAEEIADRAKRDLDRLSG